MAKDRAFPPQTQSSTLRPRRPHPKGEGQGAAAFHKPVHPGRALGEPSTDLCCRRVPLNGCVSSSRSSRSTPNPPSARAGPGRKDSSSDPGFQVGEAAAARGDAQHVLGHEQGREQKAKSPQELLLLQPEPQESSEHTGCCQPTSAQQLLGSLSASYSIYSSS